MTYLKYCGWLFSMDKIEWWIIIDQDIPKRKLFHSYLVSVRFLIYSALHSIMNISWGISCTDFSKEGWWEQSLKDSIVCRCKQETNCIIICLLVRKSIGLVTSDGFVKAACNILKLLVDIFVLGKFLKSWKVFSHLWWRHKTARRRKNHIIVKIFLNRKCITVFHCTMTHFLIISIIFHVGWGNGVENDSLQNVGPRRTRKSFVTAACTSFNIKSNKNVRECPWKLCRYW